MYFRFFVVALFPKLGIMKGNLLTTIFGIFAAVGLAVGKTVPGVIGEIGSWVGIAATALLGSVAVDAGNAVEQSDVTPQGTVIKQSH